MSSTRYNESSMEAMKKKGKKIDSAFGSVIEVVLRTVPKVDLAWEPQSKEYWLMISEPENTTHSCAVRFRFSSQKKEIMLGFINAFGKQAKIWERKKKRGV